MQVVRTEWVSRRLIKVVASGSGLCEFRDNGYADRYVKLVFGQSGVRYPEPFRMEDVRRELPRMAWPRLRTYTICDHDPATDEIAIGVGYRGDVGLGGPWAASVRPGDRLIALGPGGSYTPDPVADWHLLVGDESALPAIGAAMARVPAGTPVTAVAEVADPSEEQALACPGHATVHWLHRRHPDGRHCGEPLCGLGPSTGGDLLGAVRTLNLPAGRGHAFVHGEAGAVKVLRRHLLQERGVAREMLSASGYWRRGMSDDNYRVLRTAEKSAGID
jgi:NADPH-dependent ferric siderophore reductase